MEPSGSWFTPALLKKHEVSAYHAKAVRTQIELAKREAEIAKSLASSTSVAAAQGHCHESRRTAQNELQEAVEFAQLAGLVRTVIKMAYEAQVRLRIRAPFHRCCSCIWVYFPVACGCHFISAFTCICSLLARSRWMCFPEVDGGKYRSARYARYHATVLCSDPLLGAMHAGRTYLFGAQFGKEPCA